MRSIKQTIALLKKDALRLNGMSGYLADFGLIRWLSLCTRPEYFSLILYRFSHYFNAIGFRRLAGFLYRLNITLTGADITPDSSIGGGCVIVHTVGIVIDADIGENLTAFVRVIIEPEYARGRWSVRPQLGDNVSVGALATILGPVNIKDDTKVAPYSLVTDDSAEPVGGIFR